MPKQTIFVLTDELERVLENLPADEPRSRLEPFRTFILRWRREGRSYRNIQEILASHCGVRVSFETLRIFVKRRSRPRKSHPEVELQPAGIAPESVPMDQLAELRKSSVLTTDDVARQRALIQNLRNQPVVVREVRKRFVYDPDEPLILEKHE